MQFRKKPVVIDAVLFDASPASADAVHALASKSGRENDLLFDERGCTIKTLEGEMLASFGDFVIRGVQGELYPCKPDIFAKTYEDAADTDEAATINAFLDLCAPSLDPDNMEHVRCAIGLICKARHIDEDSIHPWGISDPQP